MTPRQARVALGGFFLLTIGVTSNALYLQGAVSGTARRQRQRQSAPSRDRPARPARQGRQGAGQGGRQGRRQGSGQDRDGGRAPKPSPECAQDCPKERQGPHGAGGDGRRDARGGGRHRHRARRAGGAQPPRLRPDRGRRRHPPADQGRHHGLRARSPPGADGRGEPGPPEATGIRHAPDRGCCGRPEVRSPHAEAIIKQIQQSLAARGYRPGAVDGQISAETVAAIRTFETDQGLVPKGRISAVVLERLQTGISAGGKHPPTEAWDIGRWAVAGHVADPYCLIAATALLV